VAPLTIESNEPIFVADSVSLKQQRASQGAQRWELSFGIQMTGNEGDFLVGLVTGLSQAKTMVMPQLVSTDNKVTATNTGVPSATAAGQSSVLINFSQIGGVLPKGSFIKFSNHAKIYMVTNAVTTSTSAVSVSIYPSLRTAVTTTHSVYHPGSSTKPLFQYYRDMETLQGLIYEDGIMVNPGTIKLIEAL
jgi:hypothetical protein